VALVSTGAQQTTSYVWFTPGAAAQTPAAGPDATADVPAQAGQTYPAVTIQVTKKPGENAVDVSTAVRTKIDALRNTVIPANVEVTVTRDYGLTAAEKANKLIQKLAFATGSVILLVGFALGRREAIIVGAAVILTLTATLFASWAWGFTLNRVSLFALIFSIGILVDDAIVVVENIHRHQQLHPDARLVKIIPRAVDEVGGPTILATLTVIAALLPMAFVSGLMGPYMSPIPINSSLGMAISLAIAFTVTPWLALKFMREHGGHTDHDKAHEPAPASKAAKPSKVQKLFDAILSPFLNSARKRWLLLGGILAALMLSVGLTVVQLVVLKMLPFDNKSEFQVVVDMPAGTPLEETAATLQELGTFLATQPEVTNLQAYAGTASPITFNGLVRQYYLRADAEQGDLQVNLVDKHHRSDKSHVIAQRLRPELEKIGLAHHARIKVVEVPPGPPVMSPLVAEIYGPDEAGRQKLARQVEQSFAATPDIVGMDTSLREDAARAFLRVRRQRADSLGIPVAAIAQTVASALSGTDAAYLHDGQSKYPVPVRIQLPLQSQVGLDAILALPMRAANGQLVPLSELVQVEMGVIDKPLFTKDLKGVSYVFGDMAGTLDSPLYGLFAIRGSIEKQIKTDMGEYWIHQPTDTYRQYALKWDGESQITYDTFRDMGAAYGVGLILIYLLVVAQFKSYLTPLVIMAPIPLTIIGVMPGHALLGSQFTATSMIGMIALAGIIVRNSILLVDFIELQVSQGVDFKTAVLQSAVVRAQPIVLTGLAAMIGAFFILDDPIFNGLAISLIFGILVSTMLTLVVIPVLYYALFRRRMQSRPDTTELGA
jgi:multidrug efflux pump subunit AcrB